MTGSNNGRAPLVEGVAGTSSVIVVVVVGCVSAAPFRTRATTFLTSSEQFSRV